jgi:hypothetical protein
MEVKMEEDLFKKAMIWVTVIVLIAYLIVEYDVYRPTKPAEEVI